MNDSIVDRGGQADAVEARSKETASAWARFIVSAGLARISESPSFRDSNWLSLVSGIREAARTKRPAGGGSGLELRTGLIQHGVCMRPSVMRRVRISDCQAVTRTYSSLCADRDV
jgi:hypothetical protein